MERRTHEVDFSRFRPLTPEQVYWTIDGLFAHLGAKASDVPWADLAAHVMKQTRSAPPIAAMKRVLPLAQRMTRLDEAAVKYSYWCQLLPDRWFTFMNYGYCDPALDTRHFDETERLWRYAPSMYEVTASVPLEGKRVLEVGCGRGGGAALLARSRAPAEYVGLDLTQSNVHFCRAVHSVANLMFVCGSALKLPWKNDRFDVLINIESAPYYRPLSKFASEAHRVLAPGGALCLTTFGDSASHRRLCRTFVRAGFSLETEVDISTRTAEALRRHRSAAGVIRRSKTVRAPALYREAFNAIYAVPFLTDGSTPYVRYVFRKAQTR